MRWSLWIVGGLVTMVAAVAAIGWRLPKAHSASRTARLPMSPDALYSLLSDVDRYPSWRAGLRRLQRLPDRNGLPAWVEETSGGKIPLYFERMERPSLLVGRIADPSLPFGGTWTYQIASAPGGGSELTITEDGEIYNPIFRFMSRFVFGYSATLDGFLGSLQKTIGH
jgi:hypothetical protein